MEIRFLEEAATWQEHFVQAMKGIWDEGELFGQLGNLFDILQDRVKQEATSTTGALTEEGQNCLKKLRQVFCQISRIYNGKGWQEVCRDWRISKMKELYWKRTGELAVLLIRCGYRQEAVLQKERMEEAVNALTDKKEISCGLQCLFDISYEQLKQETESGEMPDGFSQVFYRLSDTYDELYPGGCREALVNEQKLFHILLKFRRTEEALYRLEHLAWMLTTEKWASKWAAQTMESLFKLLYKLYKREEQSGMGALSPKAREYLGKLQQVGRQLSESGGLPEECAQLLKEVTVSET